MRGVQHALGCYYYWSQLRAAGQSGAPCDAPHTQARVPSAVDAATLRILVNGSALSALKSL